MRVKLVVVALGAIALIAAGCGSSSSSSSSSTSSSSSAAAPASNAPTGAPIKVGTICSCSGAQSSALGKSGDVMKAWADAVNAAGGINGHPVKLYVEDDGGVPTKAVTAAHTLVDQDKVVAIVGTTSSDALNWANYVQSKGIPVVGGNGFLAPFSTSPDFYPIGGQLPMLLYGIVNVAKQSGVKKLGAVYCAEVPDCAQIGGLVSAIGKSEGVPVQTGEAAVAQPNFTALCLALKQGGVDAIAVAQSAPTVTRVQQGCAQQGYNPTPFNYTSAASPAWDTNSLFNGKMKLIGGEANYQDTSIPEVVRFNAAMDKYMPGFRNSPQFAYAGTWDPWVSGVLVETAAKAANLTPTSTGADLKKGLYSLKANTLGGSTVPLTYTPGKPTFLPCYFNMKLDGGKVVTVGKQPYCLNSSQQATLGKILAG